MKRIAIAVAILLGEPCFGSPLWAQDKPAAKDEAAKPAPEMKAPAKPMARKHNPKRGEDARRCLNEPNNTAIIKCAEEYL